jgi:hypothetical protein
VRPEELGRLRKSNDLVGNPTRVLPACSLAPEPVRYHVQPRARDVESRILVWPDVRLLSSG